MPIVLRMSNYLLVAVAAFIMPFLTGFLGLLPIDQSIVFEAGGRISKGEVPFADFYIPYGLVPDLMQALFFKLFGISWFSYVLHAAVVNGIFAVIVYDVLRIWLPFQNTKKLFVGALLAAWSFYPMMGTPFMDNHSFFFGFLAYWSVLAGFSRRKPLLLICSLSFLVLGFYSKPLPVVFWICPVLMEYFLNRHLLRRNLRPVLLSLVVAIVLALLPFVIFDGQHFYYYTFYLPLLIGGGRIGLNQDHRFLRHVFANERYKIWCAIVLIAVTYFLFNIKRQEPGLRLSFYRASAILFVSIVAAALTLNTFYNLVITALVIALTVYSSLDFNRLNWPFLSRAARIVLVPGWILLTLLISWLNFSRSANDLSFSYADLRQYSPELGMYPKTVANEYTVEDIKEIYRLMNSEDCLYVGDMMFLYSVTGSKNPWPLIHLHDGTSYNSQDSIAYADVKTKLLQNMLSYDINNLIVDNLIYGKENLPQFIDSLKGRMKTRIGNMIVYEIDRVKLAMLVSNLKITREK